ncbi:hypothetical protein ESA94_20130 [Lacibacter luteus]|uniref:Bacterial Pleckstrin homology domain-containing protein n=1 Tax=Lacibacter luteus TaxID=2508719 RepID=A0A4Q1CDY9_9BACT|nr:PH domain-containing protein [Lacibacter luteus]RXK57830.1 hypothetical protein ESA94_20130 [Lacibacter luteus]
MNTGIYKTSLDSLAKGITIAITVLFASLIFFHFTILKDVRNIAPFLTIILLTIIYLIAYLFHPAAYELTADTLVIKRPASSVVIHRNTIKSVELLSNGSLSGSIRTFAVGGLFGYYGKFANSSFGSMTWYATRRNNAVLLRITDNRKIILTPDEVEKFVAAFS